MNLEAAIRTARQGRLYPAVILHGGEAEARRQGAVELGRTLLCEAPPEERPCNRCRHCRRIVWPAAAGGGERQLEAQFHPDFQVLERDLKTSTSVDGARQLMRVAQVSPFEARGQVLVVANAESLTGEAANALLKGLEEPHVSAPRHFLLLAPSRLDLLPTLRSRSLAVFLGAAAAADPERVEAVAGAFAAAAEAYAGTGAAVYLLRAAEALGAAGAAERSRSKGGERAAGDGGNGWDDPRSGQPWAVAAAAVLHSLLAAPRRVPRAARLALAEALLTGPAMRMRGISAERILEGLVARHLSGVRS
jgi:DNA polymerase III, delta subunit